MPHVASMRISRETKAANLVRRGRRSHLKITNISQHIKKTSLKCKAFTIPTNMRKLKELSGRASCGFIYSRMSHVQFDPLQAACQVQDNKPHRWPPNTFSYALVACGVCQSGMKDACHSERQKQYMQCIVIICAESSACAQASLPFPPVCRACEKFGAPNNGTSAVTYTCNYS